MAHQIIKQPNGKYMVFDVTSESIHLVNHTEEELVQRYLKLEEKKIREAVSNILAKIDKGEKPYYQFTRTLEEAVEAHNCHNDVKIDLNIL
jgi:hypothetical protein